MTFDVKKFIIEDRGRLDEGPNQISTHSPEYKSFLKVKHNAMTAFKEFLADPSKFEGSRMVLALKSYQAAHDKIYKHGI